MLENRYSPRLQAHGKWPALAIFLIGLSLLPLLTSSLLSHAPEYDELLHVLAARGVNNSGAPVIEDGVYLRAELYTRIVAAMLQFDADELVMSRLPALLAGMLLVGMTGAWVASKAGWLAGIATAGVLAIAPLTIHLSVLVRFYTLHALIVTGMLILAYEITVPGRSKSYIGISLLGIAILFSVGLHLQQLTLISAGAGIVGVCCVLLYDQRQNYLPVVLKHPALAIIALIIAAGLTGFAGVKLGVLDQLRGVTPAWSTDRASYYGFYLGALGFHMPLVWPTFSIMAVASMIDHRRLALFCLAVVGTALVANSIASQKAMRYIYHFIPILCVLWGIGFQKLINVVSETLSKRSSLPFYFSLVLVLALAAFSFANSHEFKRALKLVSGRGQIDEAIPVRSEPDWLAAKPALDALIESSSRIVVTSGVKGLYAFGKYDYELSSTVVEETETGEDFGRDNRTGRSVISTADSVSKVIDMSGDELIVLENRMLNQIYSVTSDVLSVINSRCTLVDLPEASLLSAWKC